VQRACYIPLEHGGHDLLSERPPQLAADLVLARLKPLLEDPATLKIGHNFKFDWIVLDRPRDQRARRSTTPW
jgi:DNA polymerase-1